MDIRIDGGVECEFDPQKTEGDRPLWRRPSVQTAIDDSAGGAENGAASSTSLFDLLPDILSLIDSRLSLREFARLAVVCKTPQGPWAGELTKIREMHYAVTGSEILRAIQSEPVVRPEWQSTLYSSFARKIEAVELCDHEALIGAWEARLAKLEADAEVMAYPYANSDFEAVRWFMMRASQRYDLEWIRRLRCVGVRDRHDFPPPSLMKAFPPGIGLMQILEGLLPFYRGTPAYALMIDAVGCDLAKHGRMRARISLPLLIDIGLSMFTHHSKMSNVSNQLCERLGLSERMLRRTVDPVVVQTRAMMSWTYGVTLVARSDRWRAGDVKFQGLVKDYFLGELASAENSLLEVTDLLRDSLINGGITDAVEERAHEIAWQFQTDNGSIFRGDEALAAEVRALCDAMPGEDPERLSELIGTAQKLPYYVAPFLMRYLANWTWRVAADEIDGFETVDRGAIFNDFLKWRDEVVDSCMASCEWDLVASAYAAPFGIFAGANDRWALGKLRKAAEAGFAALLPRFWGGILERLPDFGYQQLSNVFDAERTATILQMFLCDPHSSLEHAFHGFTDSLIDAAIPIWALLPDRAEGDASRIDVFSKRFGLSYVQSQSLRTKLLALVDDDAVFIGKLTVEEAMQKAGLSDDAAAVHYVEHMTWQRALRFAKGCGSDGQNVLRQSTQGSARLRQLAEIFIAGTTREPTLS